MPKHVYKKSVSCFLNDFTFGCKKTITVSIFLQIQISTVAVDQAPSNLFDKVISCRFHQTMKETYAGSGRTFWGHDGCQSYRGRERIQQLRAITLQKKKSPSFSMLRLCLLKVRKIYCSSAVNLGMIFFSRLTFLSKVNNQTYEFSINIDTGGCAFLSMPGRWLFVRRCGLK